MQNTLANLVDDIRGCRACRNLPLGPRPVLQAGSTARLLIIGQAPGRKVHQTGIPWDDASGKRLRSWLGLSESAFYDPAKVAIMPMGFCYPGKADSGDNPPNSECAPRWHDRLRAELPGIALTVLIGQYAQAHYLADLRKTTLTDTVRAWQEYLRSNWLPWPHPSPRNQPWLARNPWFEAEIIPQTKAVIRSLGL